MTTINNYKQILCESIKDINEPILLVGPAGVGKSYAVESLSRDNNLILYSYNCRRDKTLREGRNKLINWVFLKEPCIVWLEGADDLTIEAQSFLRRSLETYSRSVILILEVRDTAFLADPLRSRCRTVITPRPTKEEGHQFLLGRGISVDEANCIIQKIQPLSYRSLQVYIDSKRFLALPEYSIYDTSDEYRNAIELIKHGSASMIDVLKWKRQGLYVSKFVDDAMRILDIKWYPDMPKDSRGRNAWFHLAYILSKTQSM